MVLVAPHEAVQVVALVATQVCAGVVELHGPAQGAVGAAMHTLHIYMYMHIIYLYSYKLYDIYTYAIIYTQ